ncbi:MAG: type II toxin-antitoxin system RelE/ParE family toxin [Candidatus Tectomicrobia bacterium]
MPEIEVVFFATDEGLSPVLEWLDSLPTKVQNKCIVRIERLAQLGYELTRPEADYLRDGVYELRVRRQRVNYRMLYFFHEGHAVISHGLTKESRVPPGEIDRTIVRKALFSEDPDKHTYTDRE